MQQRRDVGDKDLAGIRAMLGTWQRPWWVAGGWAIDLCIDATPRVHHDVDIAVLRRDQLSLQQYLSGWCLNKVSEGKLVPWLAGEYLSPPVHEIHADRSEQRLEFLLNEAAGETWLFRRNESISLPLALLSRRSLAGIPYLCPQVVLLYKAKNPRPVDEDDFERALPHLSNAERNWMCEALEVCHPGHRWLSRL